jgi:hypothetical protein
MIKIVSNNLYQMSAFVSNIRVGVLPSSELKVAAVALTIFMLIGVFCLLKAYKKFKAEPKFSAEIIDIENELIRITRKKGGECSFHSITVNEDNRQWVAISPRMYYNVQGGGKNADFTKAISENQIKTLVNLMTSSEKAAWPYEVPADVNSIPVEFWEDGMGLDDNNIDQFFNAAKQAGLQARKGEPVLVHCQMSLQRTATFIAIAELFARNSAEMRKKSPDMIKHLLFSDLKVLAETAGGRLPTRAQLTMLFSDLFIAKLKAKLSY